MKETRDYLVPRYFRDFRCKMGACRKSCCEGWPVTVSMKNYFTLLGLDCRRELRDKLDCALRLTDHPTEEEYARFTPNWLGDCPMRMEDGRCSLHAELGEEVLSDVCRLYPRGVRFFGEKPECSLSNSCEGVLELLLREREPMTYRREALTLVPPPYPGSPAAAEGYPVTEEARFALLGILQDRTKSLPGRILSLRAPMGLAPVDGAADGRAVSRLLLYCSGHSESVKRAAERNLARFEERPGAYREAAEAFAARFPDWEIFFEQMLVNHAFFTQFPYQGGRLRDAWIGMAAVYGILRVLCVGGTEDGEGAQTSLVDSAAAAFRWIEHTRFGETVSRMLTEEEAAGLLTL